MLSRKSILVLSILLTFILYAVLLWIAPWVTLLESDRLATRISTRFRVEFLDSATEAAVRSGGRQQEGLRQAEISTVFGEDPGTLPIEDTLASPPLETVRAAERMAAEALERAYDLAPEPDRVRNVDARILEIAQETARQDVNIPRRLIRPSPEFSLPEGALPALRSRDIAPDDIPLEPARLGPGLLVQFIGPEMGDAPAAGDAPPPYDPSVFTAAGGAQEPVLPRLERAVAQAPVERDARQAREESDFVFMDDLVDIRLDTYVPSLDEPGYFRLRILPKPEAALEVAPKEVTFILDGSRSMQQRKLGLAARGIGDALERFRPADKFNILIFRDTITFFQSEPVSATPEAVAAARRFLDAQESRGQTDVYNALLPIAEMRPGQHNPGVILVVSDGNPTTGVRDSRAIINTVSEANGLRNSIFAYGAGNTVNRYLLDLLAYRNKGEALVSPQIEDARKDLAVFVDRFSDPLMIHLKADYGRAIKEEVYPGVIPDFFRQRPITLYGRFNPNDEPVFVARITGFSAGREKELLFRADLRKADTGGADIARGWAFEKAYSIIGEISRQGEQPGLLAELRELSGKYGIRTIYDE